MDFLPMDIVFEILSYNRNFVVKKGKLLQINRFSSHDYRYEMLQYIPQKEIDYADNITFVYLTVNDHKDLYLVYIDFEIQIQTLGYCSDENDNSVHLIDAHKYIY